jgi:dienelactone hydrolase
MSGKIIGILLLTIPFLSGGCASQQPVSSTSSNQTGRISFQSVTVKNVFDVVAPSTALPNVTISGTLVMPENPAGKVPAMVISHTAGGVGSHEWEWSKLLNKMGIATFLVDSLSGRGFPSGGYANFSSANDMLDALYALNLLASDPRIDATRIGIIGFSRGGNAALYSLLEPNRQRVITGDLRFAAHVSFYPGCSTYSISDRVDRSPTLLLLGESDDELPAAACVTLAGKLRAKGASIREIVYSGAHHAFDVVTPVTVVTNLSFKNCNVENNLDTGRASLPATGEAAPTDISQVAKSCTTRGTHEGRDDSARAKSMEDVQLFLKDTFHL